MPAFIRPTMARELRLEIDEHRPRDVTVEILLPAVRLRAPARNAQTPAHVEHTHGIVAHQLGQFIHTHQMGHGSRVRRHCIVR